MLLNLYGQLIIPQNVAVQTIKVQLWDKDLISDDFLGDSMLDFEGKFSILVSLTDAGESNPEFYLKILASDTLIFTSLIHKPKELLERNEVTEFIENSSYDMGLIQIG